MKLTQAFCWLKTLSVFAGLQVGIQLLSFLAGLIVIRVLTQEEYALYTIAFTMQGTFNVLANLGISSAIMALAGKIVNNRLTLGRLLYTGLHFRRIFTLLAMIIVGPVMVGLLIKNGAQNLYAFLITLVVLVDLNLNLLVEYYLIILRLTGRVVFLQKVELKSKLMRLTMFLVGFSLYFNALFAVFISSLTSLYKNHAIKREALKDIAIVGPINEEYRAEILKTSKRLAPNMIFYCLQGQLSIWLISIFGTTRGVAEIGALGRFAVIFSFMGEASTNYIIPAFAKIQNRAHFSRRLSQVLLLYFMVTTVLTFFSIRFPLSILWIIGENYLHLKSELTLILVGAIINSFAGMIWAIMLARAWVKFVWLNIPLILVLQLMFAIFGDLTSIRGVLWLSILSTFPGILISLSSIFIEIRKLEQ